MDRDFDGRLSFEEFMGEETTLEKLFKNMDKNNDGVVSKQVSHHENNWHHQNIDIPCQEFMTICPNLSDEQVKMAFSKFDTSGDDKLDYREFCEMIRQKVSCEMYLNHVAYYILVKPTLNNDPPLRQFGPGAFQIDPRDPRFWHTSYLIFKIYDLDL